MGQEAYGVGTGIIVADNSKNGTFGGLKTYGMTGVVCMLDDEAGVCAELFVSRVYKPRFWYSWSCLAIRQSMEPVWMHDDDIVRALGGRVNLLPDTPITFGTLRAWMIAKAHIAAGHPLERLVMAMDFYTMLKMFVDTSDAEFNAWLKDNDMRPRRPRISAGEAPKDDSFIPIRRPKIGGR